MVAYSLSCVHQQNLTFKAKQDEALFLLPDVFVWFPTGYGKSVCYHLLPTVHKHFPSNHTLLVVCTRTVCISRW